MNLRDYISLGVFLAVVSWMVYRGFAAKREYLRRKESDQKNNSAASSHLA